MKKRLLKFIHFEMYENIAEEKRLRRITDYPSEKDAVRHDEQISHCMKTAILLGKIEDEIFKFSG